MKGNEKYYSGKQYTQLNIVQIVKEKEKSGHQAVPATLPMNLCNVVVGTIEYRDSIL